MIVGGYHILLYCDAPAPADGKKCEWHDTPASFSGPFRLYAERAAKDAGWQFIHEWGERKVRCPSCRPEAST